MDAERVAHHPGGQEVPFELLEDEEEDGDGGGRGRRDRDRDQNAGDRPDPGSHERDHGRERDPETEHRRVGYTQRPERQGRQHPLRGHDEGEAGEVARERFADRVPQLAGVASVRLGGEQQAGGLYLSRVGEHVGGRDGGAQKSGDEINGLAQEPEDTVDQFLEAVLDATEEVGGEAGQ